MKEPDDMPAELIDGLGRTWQLRITVADLAPLRRLAKLELIGTAAVFDRIAELLGEPEVLVRVLFHLCAIQAKEAGVGPEDFARGFGGQVLIAGAKALTEAVVDFFPWPAETRAELKTGLTALFNPQPISSPTVGDSAG